MRATLTVTLSALMLAGCASEPGYEKSAMPDAKTTARQAAATCETEQTTSQFNASNFMACRVAAERNFVMAIHLPKMDAFETYAAEMMALAADYDAGHISLKRMDSRAASIRSHFLMVCNCGVGGHKGYAYGGFASSPTSDAGPGMPPSPRSLSLP